MSRAAFIAGDWGTSRLRLYLCDAAGQVLARTQGAGAAVPDCAGRFAAAVADWDRAHGRLPAVLGGMVGSTIGWKEVPYLECPARPQAIAGAALRFAADGRAIAIAPGLKCTNPVGAPDVMRGEEVQILGALRLHPELARGGHLLCMPGTHVKWVQLRDGAVGRFQTALSGELFELLAGHSVLARGGGSADPQSPAFALGRFLWKRGDGTVIDGFGPDGVSAWVIDVTNRVVKLQTGYLYHYAFVMLIGIVALITWMMLGSSF